MSRDTPPLIDRIPGMVWFFAGMLLTSLVVGLLLTVAHRGFATEPPVPATPIGQRPAPIVAQAETATADARSRALAMAEAELASAPPAAGAPATAPELPAASAMRADTPVVQPRAPEPPTPAAGDLAREARRAIRSTLEAWTIAWSGKDMPRYLAQYHPDFTPEGDRTRDQWAQQRQRRIAGKSGRIAVFLREIDIRLEDETATVTFIQDYDSDNYRDSTRKRLTLTRSAFKWQILREEPID